MEFGRGGRVVGLSRTEQKVRIDAFDIGSWIFNVQVAGKLRRTRRLQSLEA